MANNNPSFLPDDYLERKAQRRTNFTCASLFLVVMGAIGAAFVVTERLMKQIEQQHAATESEYAGAAKRIDQVKELQTRQRTMAGQAELTASLLEKVPRSLVLAEVTNSLPPGASLLDVSLTSKLRPPPPAPKAPTAIEAAKAKKAAKDGSKDAKPAAPPPPQPRIYDATMKITGAASSDLQVAQFINTLAKSPLFQDVNLLVSEQFEHEGRTVRRFQLDVKLDSDARAEAARQSASATVK